MADLSPNEVNYLQHIFTNLSLFFLINRFSFLEDVQVYRKTEWNVQRPLEDHTDKFLTVKEEEWMCRGAEEGQGRGRVMRRGAMQYQHVEWTQRARYILGVTIYQPRDPLRQIAQLAL